MLTYHKCPCGQSPSIGNDKNKQRGQLWYFKYHNHKGLKRKFHSKNGAFDNDPDHKGYLCI